MYCRWCILVKLLSATNVGGTIDTKSQQKNSSSQDICTDTYSVDNDNHVTYSDTEMHCNPDGNSQGISWEYWWMILKLF